MGRILVVTVFLLLVGAPTATTQVWRPPDGTEMLPDLTIVSTPDHLFTRIASIVVDDEGRLWVLDSSERSIYVFDEAGEFIRGVGRRGEGPGEFEGPTVIGTQDSMVWVSDRRLRRVTWFNAKGEVLRSLPWAIPGVGSAFTSSPITQVMADGSGVGEPGTPGAALATGEITDVPLLRVSQERRVLDTLAVLDRTGSTLMLRFGDIRSFTAQPFAAPDLWRRVPDGSGLIVLRPQVETEAGTSTFEVTRLGADGTIEYSRRHQVPARPVLESEIDSAIARIVEPRVGRLGSERNLRRRVRAELYQPTHHAPVDAVVASEDGRALVRSSKSRDGRWIWYVLGRDGRIESVVAVGSEVSLGWAGEDYVWGVQRDDLGIPSLVRFRWHPLDETGGRAPTTTRSDGRRNIAFPGPQR